MGLIGRSHTVSESTEDPLDPNTSIVYSGMWSPGIYQNDTAQPPEPVTHTVCSSTRTRKTRALPTDTTSSDNLRHAVPRPNYHPNMPSESSKKHGTCSLISSYPLPSILRNKRPNFRVARVELIPLSFQQLAIPHLQIPLHSPNLLHELWIRQTDLLERRVLVQHIANDP